MFLPVHTYKTAGAASTARLVNCFKESLPKEARQPYHLKGTPGVSTLATALDAAGATGGGIKAMHAAFDRVFFVAGTEFLMLERSALGAYTVTLLGDIGPCDATDIDIDSNADSVVVVNNPDAYYCSSTGTGFAQITDVDFTARGASDVEFLGNYLLFLEPDTGRFFGSDVGSATAYDSLSFATAESSPDRNKGIKVDHEQALLFGESTIEFWQLSGGAGFPFGKAANGIIELGCANGRTIVGKLDETLFWLASDFTVRALRGTTPQRVSHFGIEEGILACTIEDAVAWGYSQGGHIFYVLWFPERCFVLDVTENEWHERESYGEDTYRFKSACYAFGLTLVGDSMDPSGRIGVLDTAVYDELGEPLVMSWTHQPVYADAKRAFHDRLEVVHKSGVGLTSGQGSDPVIMMEVSDDGGQTFRFLPNRKLGKKGETRSRAVWHQLGSSSERVYRGSISDPVERVLYDAQLQAKGGRF